MAKKIKVGVIAMGAIGRVHTDAYRDLENVELAALAETDDKLLAAQGKRLGVDRCFSDYRELLETDVDAVSVCTPNASHRDVAVAALQAGKHVLLEKPMALNATQAADICNAARKADKVLQIGMVRRQDTPAQILREYVEKGLLGEIYHVRAILVRRRGIPGLGGWFTTKAQSGGGPMIDLGVHWVDLAMWVSGLWKPTKVSAKTYAKFGPRMEDYNYVGMWAGPPRFDGVFDVEDYSTGFVRFGKEATMAFEIVWAANQQESGYIEYVGTEGGARISDDGKLTILTEHEGRVADITPMFKPREGLEAFTEQARCFVAACQGGVPAATGEEGLVVMRLIDAIYASSEAGEEVSIES